MKRQISLPSMSVLRCFEAAAKHQSFTAAAEDLGLTQSGVSRQVKDLEEQIGASLFRRDGRGIRLTQAGETFAEALSLDLAQLRRSLARAVAAGDRREVLTISVLPTFGARWLIPRLGDFKSINPHLNLMLYSKSSPFDLVEAGIDVAIHFGAHDWPGASLAPLCTEDLVVAASPNLSGVTGAMEADDILHLPRLHMTSRPHLWQTFAGPGTEAANRMREGDYFDQFALCIGAAVSGLGAAILPAYLIETELASGTLIQLAEVDEGTSNHYSVATPTGSQNKAATSFLSWIRKQVRKRPP